VRPMDASAQMLRDSERLLTHFRSEFEQEVPTRIHNRDTADDGAPQWAPEFVRWLTARDSDVNSYITNPEHRLRTRRAMRKLRSTSVRSFEVVWRVMGSEKVEDTARWLNDRAERNAIPLPIGRTRHYNVKDALAILYAGLTYMEWCY
jgi:hypothetical protein